MSTVRLRLGGDGCGRVVYATVTEAGQAAGPATAATGTRARSWAEQFTRVLLTDGEGSSELDEHLRIGFDAPLRRRRLADVLVGPDCGAGTGSCSGSDSDPGSGSGFGASHPGALVVAVHRGTECVLRFGAGAFPSLTLGARQAVRAPWQVWASLAHAWLAAGLPVEEFASVSGCAVP